MNETRSLSRRLLLCCTLLVLSFSATAGAKLFIAVDPSDLVDIDTADGDCMTVSGFCTLRAAIQQANASAGTDTIVMGTATYALAIPGTLEDDSLSGDLDITDSVIIIGAGPGKTIIDAKGLDRVFDVHNSSSVTISKVTIRGGAATDSGPLGSKGGGILVRSGASLDLAKCEVQGNKAVRGGGLFVLQSIPIPPGSTLTSATISDCSFRDNMAITQGSAIYTSGEMDLDRVEVTGNTSSQASGAVWSEANAIAAPAPLSIRNSTISGNSDQGLRAQNVALDLINSTVHGNGSGGLLFYSFDGSHSLTVRNTILANNGVGDCLPFTPPNTMDFTGEHNLDSDGTCPLDAGVVDLPATDPMLGPLQLNGGTTRTHVPLVGSPVIDAGNNARCEVDDQRGATRPLDGGPPSTTTCDIGAVEVLPCDPPFNPDEFIPFREIFGSETFEGCYTVTHLSFFRIFNGGDVVWKARNSMILKEGFQVLTGGTFTAILDPSAGSFTALP